MSSPTQGQALSRLIEHMQDGYFQTSLDGGILRVNPACVEMLRYADADELVGRVNVRELYVDPARRAELLAQLSEHGYVASFEVDFKCKDDAIIRLELTAGLMLGEDGKPIGLDGVIRDVTDRHRREQQFRSLVRNVPGAIYQYSEGEPWSFSFMSHAIEAMTGHPPEHFIGENDPFAGLLSPEEPDLVARIRENADLGEAFSFEQRVIHTNGATRWLRIQGSKVRDPATNLADIDGVMLDVTEELETQQALGRSEATFRHLFEAMSDGYWVNQADGSIELLNPAAVRILGYPDAETLKSRNAADLWTDAAQRDSALSELRVNGSVEDREVEALRYDGTSITVNVTLRLVGRGTDAVMEVTFRDITKQKRADAEIRTAREAAENANRAKSAFLANMSHELRTPLNAILGYSDLLIEEAEDLEQDDFSPDLKKIHHAGTHLLALINDVLDLSKIEAGKMEIYVESFEIEDLVGEVSATVAPLISKNNNELVIDLGDELGGADQDLTKIRQTLLNLLSNAAKFTQAGRITLAARRERRNSEDWVTISVQDTGIGVPEDKLGKLFEEFSQAEVSTTRDYGGTGLGLAIARRFCRMLGGDVTVESSVGEGSTFSIQLPAALPSALRAAAKTAPTTAVEEPRPPASIPALPTHPGRTILVIDDDAEACELLRTFLTRDGFEVATAYGGAQGLALAREIRPAAITLDVMMPDMDGWSVLSALAADHELKDIPVIMVTMVDDQTTGYTLGATDYLTKPIDRRQLLNSIKKHRRHGDRVLVVEDDVDTRDMLGRILSGAGWLVSEASNGREALEAMAREKPDLILLDLMMPVMNGFDFLVEMRASPKWLDVPVIVATAKDLTEEEREQLNGSVTQVLAKGAYTRDQLVEAVRRSADRVGRADPPETLS